jgi:hypothetical membrane protein
MYRISRTHFFASMAAFLGLVQFVVALSFAIHFYPGGYSIFDNFISDLGCLRTLAGQNNLASAEIFNLSVIILGAALIPFFWVLPTTISKLRKTIRLSGTLSALGLIGIGMTPYDKFFVAHHLALGLWIMPMFILLIAHLIASVADEQASAIRTAMTLLLLAAIFLYISAGTRSGYVVMQKLTAAVAIVWFSLVGKNLGVTVVQLVSPRRQMMEQEAERYTEILKRGQCLKTGKPRDADGKGPTSHGKDTKRR